VEKHNSISALNMELRNKIEEKREKNLDLSKRIEELIIGFSDKNEDLEQEESRQKLEKLRALMDEQNMVIKSYRSEYRELEELERVKVVEESSLKSQICNLKSEICRLEGLINQKNIGEEEVIKARKEYDVFSAMFRTTILRVEGNILKVCFSSYNFDFSIEFKGDRGAISDVKIERRERNVKGDYIDDVLIDYGLGILRGIKTPESTSECINEYLNIINNVSSTIKELKLIESRYSVDCFRVDDILNVNIEVADVDNAIRKKVNIQIKKFVFQSCLVDGSGEFKDLREKYGFISRIVESMK
jgi:hypothetical protein